jgi:hypothetical protein
MSIADRRFLRNADYQCRRMREAEQLSRNRPLENVIFVKELRPVCQRKSQNGRGNLRFPRIGIKTLAQVRADRYLFYAEKDVPQPHVPVALGLVNLKPPP